MQHSLAEVFRLCERQKSFCSPFEDDPLHEDADKVKLELALPEKYSKQVRVSGRMIVAQRFMLGSA
jgi:hypothetical protein